VERARLPAHAPAGVAESTRFLAGQLGLVSSPSPARGYIRSASEPDRAALTASRAAWLACTCSFTFNQGQATEEWLAALVRGWRPGSGRWPS